MIVSLAKAFKSEDWAAVERLSADLRRLNPSADPAAGFQVLPTDHIFAPLPKPEYVIDGVLRKGALMYWAAYGSSSKTWQALDASVAVATGTPWLGRFPVKQGSSGFLDYESGDYECRRRLQALARGRGLETVPGLGLVVLPGLRLGEPAFNDACERLAEGKALLGIDSLRAASNEDENDSRIRKGLDGLRGVAERTGCAMGVLVHAKKTSGMMSEIDKREILRGSSAIFDAADTVLVSFYRDAEGCYDVLQAKSRHGRDIDPFRLRLVDVGEGSVRIETEDMPDKETEGEEKRASDLALVRALISDNPRITIVGLRDKCKGIGKDRLEGVLDELARTGVVEERSEPCGPGRPKRCFVLL